jgi:Zn-dependent membrane protease YugP
MNGLFFDPTYLFYAVPGLLLAMWAQFTLKSTFATYSRVATSSGITGSDAANILIRATGVRVGVKSTQGVLTDFYNPADKTINLSQSSGVNSVASVAVVAHEMGHAVQDAESYGPMRLRATIVPAVQVGGWVGPAIFLVGFLLHSQALVLVGLIGFGVLALFSLATLPVEFNASKRALVLLQSNNILRPEEIPGAKKVLDAAALTYVAAALQSVGTLLYYLSLSRGMRERR